MALWISHQWDCQRQSLFCHLHRRRIQWRQRRGDGSWWWDAKLPVASHLGALEKNSNLTKTWTQKTCSFENLKLLKKFCWAVYLLWKENLPGSTRMSLGGSGNPLGSVLKSVCAAAGMGSSSAKFATFWADRWCFARTVTRYCVLGANPLQKTQLTLIQKKLMMLNTPLPIDISS